MGILGALSHIGGHDSDSLGRCGRLIDERGHLGDMFFSFFFFLLPIILDPRQTVKANIRGAMKNKRYSNLLIILTLGEESGARGPGNINSFSFLRRACPVLCWLLDFFFFFGWSDRQFRS